MNKVICGTLVLIIMASGIVPVVPVGEVSAGINVEVNIGPPVIMMDEPPEVVYAPGFGVYFVPDAAGIFFYSGFWWSRRGNYWYRSRYYRRGWVVAAIRDVPGPILRVPRDYRKRFAGEKRIRYRDWKERPVQQKNAGSGGAKNTDRGGNWGMKPQGADTTGRGGYSAPNNGGKDARQNGGRGAEREGNRKSGDEGGGGRRGD